MKGPSNNQEVTDVTKIYERLGLPGCVGSADCVHIRWDMCPAQWHTLFKGKESYPSIAYEMTVSHNKKIMACTTGRYGSRNDKTIVRFDGFITDIHYGNKYSEYEFKLQKEADLWIKEQGIFLLFLFIIRIEI